jgi:hypothetical protein
MSKFKMVEYLGIIIIALPITATILYFISNKKDNPVQEKHQIENVDSIEKFILAEPIKAKVQKVEKHIVKKEPIKKIDSIVEPKEIKEETKIDISEKYILEP